MDLREIALEERRAALSAVLERHEDAVLRFSEDLDDCPESMLKSACQRKPEGLIGKRAGSTYVSWSPSTGCTDSTRTVLTILLICI
ncbi:MAG: hypothetical protein ACREYF_02310 [Gammaproteobacteria bacterium]